MKIYIRNYWRCMMIKNNKGFGSREMLTVSTICLILATILLMIAIESSYEEKYKVMEYNARVFGLSATIYEMENNNDSVYMIELLDDDMFTRIKNPFGGPEYCSSTESKVEYEGERKYITLRCGNYLIDHQYIAAEEYKIYRIGQWQEKKLDKNAQKIESYNYKEKGKEVFNEVYGADMFLYAFNKKTSSDYESIEQIPKKYGVYSKTFYRTKKLVQLVDGKEIEQS